MRHTETGALGAAIALTIAFVWAPSAFAQTSEAASVPAYPDFLELNGDASSGLYLLPDAQFNVTDGGTLEFWVEPTWDVELAPDYDPVIFSAAGPDGAALLVAMLRNQKGLALLSGDQEAVFEHDFTTKGAQHVALNIYDENVILIMNGEPVSVGDFDLADPAPSGVWIGSADGATAPFQGFVGGLRIWDIPVEPEIVANFRFTDVIEDSDEVHPDIDFLKASSDFSNRDVLVLDPAFATEGGQ